MTEDQTRGLHGAAAGVAAGATALTAVGAATLAYASGVERRAYTLREVRVPILQPGTAPRSGELRLLHLSDLHLAPWQRDKIAWINGLAASTEPDLVINTGDNFGHRDALDAIVEALEPLLRLPGAFVYGSNDQLTPEIKNPLRYLWGPSKSGGREPDIDTAALTRVLTGAGWRNLNNDWSQLRVVQQTVSLVGTGDAHVGQHRPYLLPGNLAQAASAARQAREKGEGAILLGVTHAPYRAVIDPMTNAGADLILAGHTHGGQVRFPGFGALVTNCDLPREYVRGLHRWTSPQGASTWLHVSAGLGTSIYAPVRFACRPEATLLHLVERDQG